MSAYALTNDYADERLTSFAAVGIGFNLRRVFLRATPPSDPLAGPLKDPWDDATRLEPPPQVRGVHRVSRRVRALGGTPVVHAADPSASRVYHGSAK